MQNLEILEANDYVIEDYNSQENELIKKDIWKTEIKAKSRVQPALMTISQNLEGYYQYCLSLLTLFLGMVVLKSIFFVRK